MIIEPINNDDITILMHGGQQENLKSIDYIFSSLIKAFPSSKIILSTWDNVGTSLYDFQYDKVIKSKDPGATQISQNPPRNHALKRHIVSTVNGLKAVKSKYCLIVRDDVAIKKSFIKKYIKYAKLINEKDIFFKQPILCLAEGSMLENYLTKNFLRKFFFPNNFLFHTCDFLYFGLTKDLNNFFKSSLPLDDPPFFDFIKKYPNFLHEKRQFTGNRIPYYQKYVSETYPVIKFLGNKKSIKMPHSWITSNELALASKNWHVNNIILINMGRNKIFWTKKQFLSNFPSSVVGRYSEYKWLAYHHKYFLKFYFNSLHFLYYFYKALQQILFTFPFKFQIKFSFKE